MASKEAVAASRKRKRSKSVSQKLLGAVNQIVSNLHATMNSMKHQTEISQIPVLQQLIDSVETKIQVTDSESEKEELRKELMLYRKRKLVCLESLNK